MKKVIRLTESDLVRIVKRVINESKKNPHPNKGIVYDGVKITTVSPSGGPVYLTYKGKKLKYTIKVSVKNYLLSYITDLLQLYHYGRNLVLVILLRTIQVKNLS